MKHKEIFVVALGSMTMAIVVGLWSLTVQQGFAPTNDDIASVATTISTRQADSLQFGAGEFKNLGGIEEGFGMNFDAFRYYKMDWTNIYQVRFADRIMYVGEMTKTSGNGLVDPYPLPLFAIDKVLYVPWGTGGEQYPPKETNWIVRYKAESFDYLIPVEEYSSRNIDREILETYRIKLGISNIRLIRDKTGKLVSITLSEGEKVSHSDGPFEAVLPVNLITRLENKGADDYLTYIEQSRTLAGNATGQVSFVADNGYTITYPEYLNGKKVSYLKDGENSYTFRDEDKQYQPNATYLNCWGSQMFQTGPKLGDPIIIASESRSKLVDWGVSKQHHGEMYSFTGPGAHCTILTTEAFKPGMFKISF